jgi:hypothetical protein
MWTTNDETNAAMLAVNRRLGYLAAGRRVDSKPGSDPCISGSDMAALHGNQGPYKGNGFFASAARTCDVTHTGVVTYCAE